MVTRIYGASDDLVEIEGDISEEFYYPSEDKCYLATDKGHLIQVRYDGTWILRFKYKPVVSPIIKQYPAGSDEAIKISGRDYTDVLEIQEDIKWVMMGSELGGR